MEHERYDCGKDEEQQKTAGEEDGEGRGGIGGAVTDTVECELDETEEDAADQGGQEHQEDEEDRHGLYI